jgi:hypothetical protein
MVSIGGVAAEDSAVPELIVPLVFALCALHLLTCVTLLWNVIHILFDGSKKIQ